MQDFKAHSDDTNVDFEIIVTEEKMNMIKQDILKKLKLTTTISTSNMHLFDADGVIKKYDTPEQSMFTASLSHSFVSVIQCNNEVDNHFLLLFLFAVLEDFFSLRLEFYEKRKVRIPADENSDVTI